MGTIKVILVAAPQYLKTFGTPETKEALSRFNILSFHNEKKVKSIAEYHFESYDPNIIFKCNSFPLLYHMTLQGKGIATLPDFFAINELKNGSLIQVLPDWSTPTHDLHLLYAPTKQMPLKIRTFIDFIAERSKEYLKQTT